jgi:galactokinase
LIAIPGSPPVDEIAEFDLANIVFDEEVTWSNYVRGGADVYQKEGYKLNGFDGMVHSTIPFGSRLSSSAALEVATAILLESLAGPGIASVSRAILCLRAENEFVGLNCGILDQYSSAMGEEGRVLLLDCRSITSQTKPITPDVQVMICDTRAKRALTGSEYPDRRAQYYGVSVEKVEEALKAIEYPGVQSVQIIFNIFRCHQGC